MKEAQEQPWRSNNPNPSMLSIWANYVIQWHVYGCQMCRSWEPRRRGEQICARREDAHASPTMMCVCESDNWCNWSFNTTSNQLERCYRSQSEGTWRGPGGNAVAGIRTRLTVGLMSTFPDISAKLRLQTRPNDSGGRRALAMTVKYTNNAMKCTLKTPF